MILSVYIGDRDPGQPKRLTNHLDVVTVYPRSKLSTVRARGLGVKEGRYFAIEVDSSDLSDDLYQRVADYIMTPDDSVTPNLFRKNRFRINSLGGLVSAGLNGMVNSQKARLDAGDPINDREQAVENTGKSLDFLMNRMTRVETNKKAKQDPDWPT